MTEEARVARRAPAANRHAARVPVAVWLSAREASIDVTKGMAEPKTDAQRGRAP
jgi:hypothetical protein